MAFQVGLFTIMRYIGIADSFITMIWNLHHNTATHFVVNGMLSDLISVFTGIRQGCPLASILLHLVADILAIVPLQSTQIQELRHGLSYRNSPLSSMIRRFSYTTRGKCRRYCPSCVALESSPVVCATSKERTDSGTPPRAND